MMRSGYPPESYQWEDEYYQATLRDLGDHNFTQSVFAPKAALVPRRTRADGLLESEFDGQGNSPPSRFAVRWTTFASWR